MEKIRKYILFAVLLFGFQNGFGQQSASLTLDESLEMAAKNNPELKAAFNQYLAALEKVPQLGALPDPQASFGFFVKPMAIMGGEQLANIQLMQMFPWFGTLQTAKDEATVMAKAKFELFNISKADLFYQVKANWYQLMKIDREIKLVEENIEILNSLENMVLIKYQSPVSGGNSSNTNSSSMGSSSNGNINASAGGMNGMNAPNISQKPSAVGMAASSMSGGMENKATGLQDVLRVKMEILEVKNKLATLLDQRKTIETGFNAFLNRDLKTSVQISGTLLIQELPSERLAIADSILNNNPMLAMLGDEISSYKLMEQKAKKMGLPMMGIGINYMLNQKRTGNTFMMNGNDMLMPMVSVSIPIYRKKYNAMQNEARLMQDAGKEQTIAMQNSLMVQYRNFVQDIDDAERRIDLYQEQELLARKTLDLLVEGFANGETNYDEVLRMQEKVLDYGFKHVEAITDYNTAVATAEKLSNSIKIKSDESN